MHAAIKNTLPDPHFWADYSLLWKESSSKSPFQSPHFIQSLVSLEKESIAYYTCYHETKLIAATFFRLQKGVYGFLSDVKTDHNFFLIHQACSSTEIESIFGLFFDNVKKHQWKLKLNYQPTWAAYWPSFNTMLNQSGLFFDGVPYSVSPMLSFETAEQLRKKLTGSRNTKYKRNRLIKEQQGDIEIYREAEDMESWVQEFCTTHINKWSTTSTPSAYQNKRKQILLKQYLEAWYKDGILVRFALRTPEKRIAFCIGLIQGKTFLHHSHTYDQSFQKYSPGKVLMYYIGTWCGEAGMTTLDFGEGQEKFKFNYANTNPVLDRIYIAPRKYFGFSLVAKFMNSFKRQDRLNAIYQKHFRPIYIRFKHRKNR